MNAYDEVRHVADKVATEKAILQSAIYRLLEKFRQETGIYVTDITIARVDTTTAGGGRRCIVTHVNIETERVL